MDKVEHYSSILTTLIEEKAAQQLAGLKTVLPHPIIDEKRKEYLLMWMGREKDNYIHVIMFHFQLTDGSVLIHQNNTDIDLKALLIDDGVSQEDIVIPFN